MNIEYTGIEETLDLPTAKNAHASLSYLQNMAIWAKNHSDLFETPILSNLESIH